MNITSINNNKAINPGVGVVGTSPAQSTVQDLLDANARNLKSLNPFQLANYRDFNSRIVTDLQSLFNDITYPPIGEDESSLEEGNETSSGSEFGNIQGKGTGQNMLPVVAARTLLKYIDFLDTAAGEGGRDGQFTLKDLEAIADNPALPAELKKAVEYVLKNPAILNSLDVAAGMGEVDGVFAKTDLETFIEKYSGVEGFDKTYESQAIKDAIIISKAGDWTEVMEIVTKLSNDELKTLKTVYKKFMGGEISEAGALKTAPGGPRSLLLKLLGYGPAGLDRQAEGEVDQARVESDAIAIKSALTPESNITGGGGMWGRVPQSSKIGALVELMGSRSKAHLQEVSKAYQEKFGKSLKEAILQDLKSVEGARPVRPLSIVVNPTRDPKVNVEATKRALLMLFN